MFLCPANDLLSLPVRASVAVLPSAVALVQEALVVALHLVVERDAPDAPTTVADALLGTFVGAVDLHVVGLLARFP
jgi:hypothetical protein